MTSMDAVEDGEIVPPDPLALSSPHRARRSRDDTADRDHAGDRRKRRHRSRSASPRRHHHRPSHRDRPLRRSRSPKAFRDRDAPARRHRSRDRDRSRRSDVVHANDDDGEDRHVQRAIDRGAQRALDKREIHVAPPALEPVQIGQVELAVVPDQAAVLAPAPADKPADQEDDAATPEEPSVEDLLRARREARRKLLEEHSKRQQGVLPPDANRVVAVAAGGSVAIPAADDDRFVDAVVDDVSDDERDDAERRPVRVNGQVFPATQGSGAEDVAESQADDDDIDIFGDSPINPERPSLAIDSGMANKVAETSHENHTLLDNWDDAEGYYCFRLGDVLHEGRYEVFANQGRGVFSTVLRVRDRSSGNKELVIKVIRQNDVMYKAAQKEVNLLNLLKAHDPDNHRHCVRLFSHFEHRGHLCLVFEPLHLNLREVLKKFGGVGINLEGVRSYAKQLFVALRLLTKCEIVHADIKPDNILVNQAMNVLKLCDFGSAGMTSDCDITPYLVSRFYRAPEIILGLPYGSSIDVWAVGCVLFELYTGQILFKGNDNNDMLYRILEIRGKFAPKLLRRGTFVSQHFDADLVFERRRVDKVTGGELKTKLRFDRPSRDMLSLLRSSSAGRLTEEETRTLIQLRDLLDKCLALDPLKRITPEAARTHPFLQ